MILFTYTRPSRWSSTPTTHSWTHCGDQRQLIGQFSARPEMVHGTLLHVSAPFICSPIGTILTNKPEVDCMNKCQNKKLANKQLCRCDDKGHTTSNIQTDV